MTKIETTEFWERLYGEHDQQWSGGPNVTLVETVTGLVPGAALDLGCGEGGDSARITMSPALDVGPYEPVSLRPGPAKARRMSLVDP